MHVALAGQSSYKSMRLLEVVRCRQACVTRRLVVLAKVVIVEDRLRRRLIGREAVERLELVGHVEDAQAKRQLPVECGWAIRQRKIELLDPRIARVTRMRGHAVAVVI